MIIIILLFLISIFFSISETALRSLNNVKLQTQANQGDTKAEKLLEATEDTKVLFIATLIGNNIIDLLIVALVALWALEQEYNVALPIGIAIFLVIIVAELIPRTIAKAIPTKIANVVAPIIRAYQFVLTPIIWVLEKLMVFIARRFDKEEHTDLYVSKEELRTLVDLAGMEGAFEKSESYRLKGVIDFYQLNVKDVMKTPRVEIVALPIDSTYEEVRDFAVRNRYTRYPVYDGDIDHIVGIMHTKYLLTWSVNPEKTLADFIDTDPFVVYEFQPIEPIFRSMIKQRRHLAIVLDEYGGTEGIITHEDMIETMIGLEIEDEMDVETDVLIERLTPREIICDGKVTLHQLNSIFETTIPVEEDVLAAYLLSEFKDFPQVGDVLEKENGN